ADLHRYDRTSGAIDGFAADSFAMQVDAEALPQSRLSTVHVHKIVVTAPEPKRVLQAAAGGPLIVRGRTDVEGHAVVAQVFAQSKPVTGQLRPGHYRTTEGWRRRVGAAR